MRDLWKDVAFGVRTQLRTPAATAAVVVTLALGIAAATVTFSLLNSFFIRPLPVREPQRLVRIYTSYPNGPRHFTVSYPDFADMRDLDGVFAGVLAEEPVPLSLSVAGAYERIWGERVSQGYFSILGLRPAHGRFFAPAEAWAPEGDPAVVIGHGLWQRVFGGSPDVLGETLILNGHAFKIIGVAPKGFQGMSLGLFPDVWLPVIRQGDALNNRGARGYFALGRLKPAVAMDQAQAALDTLARRLEQAYPDSNRGVRFTALSEAAGRIHPMVRGSLLGFSGMLIAVAALLLLLACANVATVLLARAVSRRKEVGVRLALGATRARIVRQLLTEGASLSLVAGATGVALAWAATSLLNAIPLPTARGAPLAFDLGLDARVLGLSVLVAALTGILFGLTPALEASRSDLVLLLKGGHLERGLGPSRVHAALVAAQVGLSMVLLIGGGLFVRSLQNAYRLDLGFDPKDVIVGTLDVAPRGYGRAESMQFWRLLRDRIAALPSTRSVSLADRIPFEVNITTLSVVPEADPVPRSEAWPVLEWAVVDRGYFSTLRIQLLEGRDFGERDTESAPPAVIVNDVLARRFWPGTRAAGKRLVDREGRPYEVVGVVKRSKHLTLGEEPKPYLYLPLGQVGAPVMTVVARAGGDPGSYLRELRETVRSIDDAVPFYNVGTLSERTRLAFLPATGGATALSLVALVALTLTSLGLYGLVSYTVNRRTHEIGLRRALGARNDHVVWFVVRQALFHMGLGLAAGAGVGFIGSHLVSSFLYGVRVLDPLAFGLAPALLVLVSVIASWMPAHRATRIEPAVALRQE